MSEKLLISEKKLLVLQYSTKISKVKIFYVLQDKAALLTWRHTERGKRNRQQRIFRKVSTTCRKRWWKDEFLMILIKLRLGLLLTNLSQLLGIYLVVYILWPLHSSFSFMDKDVTQHLWIKIKSHRFTYQIWKQY